ncbi:MAG TPA: M1 family metallopeptidase [Gemmatimonadaceae bacterium]|nr:M1 family metallopeptidase [Gemmatimonadaceae bacterium]
MRATGHSVSVTRGLVRDTRAGMVAALIILGATGLFAQGVTKAHPYRRGVHVIDYDLALQLPVTGPVIQGTAILTVQRSANVDTLILDLLDLKVSHSSVGGHEVPFVQTADAVDIPLPPRRGARDDTLKVEIQYGGAVTDGLIVRTDSAGRWTGFGDDWPNRARHWIPSIDHPSDKATVTWRVTAPPGRTVVANGDLVSTKPVQTPAGPMTLTTWRESRPIAAYMMVIAAAPLVRFDLGETACGLAAMQRCVAQSVYTAPEQAKFMPGAFAHEDSILPFFARLIAPFPFEKLSHLQSSTRFGGMENATAIFYADGPFRGRGTSESTIAHETAHQWFGDAVTEGDWSDLWLSEGFATYFASLWTQHEHGDSAFRAEMASTRRRVTSDRANVPTRPVIDTAQTNLNALLNANSYQKGAFVLHMLRTQLGDSAFFRGLRIYFKAHEYGNAFSDDLRAALEHSSGVPLKDFFDQWLRRPGFPELTISWSYDQPRQRLMLDVQQGVRFGAFRLPLRLAVVDSAGVSHLVQTDLPAQPHTAVEIPLALARAPISVIADPLVESLATFSVIPK